MARCHGVGRGLAGFEVSIVELRLDLDEAAVRAGLVVRIAADDRLERERHELAGERTLDRVGHLTEEGRHLIQRRFSLLDPDRDHSGHLHQAAQTGVGCERREERLRLAELVGHLLYLLRRLEQQSVLAEEALLGGKRTK